MPKLRACAALALLLPSAAAAQSTRTVPAATLPAIEVVGTSPVLGTGIDRDKVPAGLRTLGAGDLAREGTPDLAGTLLRRVPGIGINDVQGNPFQPTIQFRGFEASPVPGAPQGLAVYQNGVRINEAYGDTVNWDLIPEVAIDRLSLMTGNPVFGLNALGGALALEMKNGFTFQGAEAELRGGSFGRRAGSLQYGAQVGAFAAYVAAEALNEDGWRDRSPSELRRLYADVGGRGERTEIHFSFSGAANRFGATAATPVELVDRRREAVYTTPQTFRNDVSQLTLTGTHQVTDTLSFQANAYYRAFRQSSTDGNTADIGPCPRRPDFLCLDDDRLVSVGGARIPNLLGGAVAGTIDRTKTTSDGTGGALQLAETTPLFGLANRLVAGASVDRGVTDFGATSELGLIGGNLVVSGTGITIAQPDGEITPVRVRTTSTYSGFYATDTLDLTPDLAVTAGGRLNLADVRLRDRLGTSLNGDHHFSRFNPAAGATYKVTPTVTAYAGYSEANRVPTPSELGCADPARPCLLANFVVSDPPLKQVVSRTVEAGLRGGFDLAGEGSRRISWNLGVFNTDSEDDIINVASSTSGRGYFQNAGNSRRQGIEAGLSYRSESWFLHADYGLVDATFRSSLTLNSPGNPAADDGVIAVRPGDHLPLVPRHRFKAGADYALTPDWKIGTSLLAVGSQYLRGDESNRNPKLAGYWIANLHSSYDLTEHLQVFALVQNLFDRKYETFGTFFDASQIPFLGLTNPRTVTPGAPLGAFVGLRATF